MKKQTDFFLLKMVETDGATQGVESADTRPDEKIRQISEFTGQNPINRWEQAIFTVTEAKVELLAAEQSSHEGVIIAFTADQALGSEKESRKGIAAMTIDRRRA